MSYYGSRSFGATFHGFKTYTGQALVGYVYLPSQGAYARIEENFGIEREMLGRYSIVLYGWGYRAVDFSQVTKEEKKVLFQEFQKNSDFTV